MARPKLRVLLDLSMACRGYCGIAQDVRLLYKTLSACPELEVTGLIYPPQKLARRHRFCSPRKTRADRLANQAEFFWKLTEGGFDWTELRSWRGLKYLPAFAHTVLARRAKCDRVDAEFFRDVIWRMMFSQTLSVDDIPIVARGEFLLANLSDGKFFARGLANRRPIQLDTRGYDYLIVQGPRPLRTSPGTRLIVRYHDMIPMLSPDSMSNPRVTDWHHKAIRQGRDSYFVCNSEPTRDDLVSVFPPLAERSTTIPYMLSDAYRPDSNYKSVRSIINLRRSTAAGVESRRGLQRNPRYLMSVSTLEPRKNFVGLIRAFHQMKAQERVRREVGDLKLLIVGSPGWKYESILAAMRPGIQRGEVVHLERVSTAELRVLYTHAEAFVFPSYAEGFGFPPMEAMQCDTPVIVSDIAAHRWVMGDAALYCNPYDVNAISAAIERLILGDQSQELRAELIARGRQRVARYTLARCSSQWSSLLQRLQHGQAAASCAESSEILPTTLLERAA